jgi:hypothetical protein
MLDLMPECAQITKFWSSRQFIISYLVSYVFGIVNVDFLDNLKNHKVYFLTQIGSQVTNNHAMDIEINVTLH